MAKISIDLINSDDFLDMPLSSQALYFHIAINSKNGFCNRVKATMREINATKGDLEILVKKRYLIQNIFGNYEIKL